MKIAVKKMTQARKKQLAVLAIVAAVLGVVVASAVFFIESRKAETQEQVRTQQKERVVATDFASPQAAISDSALWSSTEGAKIDNLESRVNELQTQLARAGQQADSMSGSGLGGPDGLGQPSNQADMSVGSTTSLPPPPTDAIPSAPTPTKTIQTLNVGLDTDNASVDSGNQTITSDGTVRLAEDFKKSNKWARVNGPRMNIEVVEDGGDVVHSSSVSKGKFRARDSYIPSGTFFRSVLLGGVDAPTGGEAQNASPHPVLMRVTDFAQLPNRFKYNFRECFVTGQAYGDIAAERAYIRLQNLSCVGTDGRAIDMPVRGYVAGEDGKTGVRGTVVTKQGQVLANALLAGVLGSLGQGVSQSFNVTNNTPFGSTTSVGGSDQYKAAVAQGIGNAADRLAQYYIKLADKIFPVIEVNAGRTVDIVLTRGIEIDTQEDKE